MLNHSKNKEIVLCCINIDFEGYDLTLTKNIKKKILLPVLGFNKKIDFVELFADFVTCACFVCIYIYIYITFF